MIFKGQATVVIWAQLRRYSGAGDDVRPAELETSHKQNG
jgi:hypothetical protein